MRKLILLGTTSLVCFGLAIALFCIGGAADDANTTTRHTTTEHEAALQDALVWMYSVYNSDLGTAGQTESYLISTPATNKYHFKWQVYATGGVYMYIYEDPTISDTQTESTVYVKNRIYDTASPISVWTSGNFTITDTGSTIIRQAVVAGGNKAGGFGGSDTGWILEQGEQYYILLTAIAANPAYSLALQWHRHNY